MSVISKKSFLNKADKQQSNWEQTTGQEAGGVLNKQDFIRQAQSAAQQRRRQKHPMHRGQPGHHSAGAAALQLPTDVLYLRQTQQLLQKSVQLVPSFPAILSNLTEI